MKRSEAITLLAQSKPILAKRYGVTQLALFGSTARDVASSSSDADVLVACRTSAKLQGNEQGFIAAAPSVMPGCGEQPGAYRE